MKVGPEAGCEPIYNLLHGSRKYLTFNEYLGKNNNIYDAKEIYYKNIFHGKSSDIYLVL